MQLVDVSLSGPVTAPAPARRSSSELRDDQIVDLPRSFTPAPNPAPIRSGLDVALWEHARLLRRRLEGHPDVAAQQAAEKLARNVIAFTTATMDVVNAELGDVLRVGVVVSSARPGLKRVGLVLTDRLHGNRRLECSLTTSPKNQELVLLAESLGRVAEVVRVAVRDPEAATMLRDCVERFLLESAERFANAAGASRTSQP